MVFSFTEVMLYSQAPLHVVNVKLGIRYGVSCPQYSLRDEVACRGAVSAVPHALESVGRKLLTVFLSLPSGGALLNYEMEEEDD